MNNTKRFSVLSIPLLLGMALVLINFNACGLGGSSENLSTNAFGVEGHIDISPSNSPIHFPATVEALGMFTATDRDTGDTDKMQGSITCNSVDYFDFSQRSLHTKDITYFLLSNCFPGEEVACYATIYDLDESAEVVDYSPEWSGNIVRHFSIYCDSMVSTTVSTITTTTIPGTMTSTTSCLPGGCEIEPTTTIPTTSTSYTSASTMSTISTTYTSASTILSTSTTYTSASTISSTSTTYTSASTISSISTTYTSASTTSTTSTISTTTTTAMPQ